MAGTETPNVDVILNMLLGKMGAVLVNNSAPPQQPESTPAAAAPPPVETSPPVYKADAIASIISETYNMPGVPDSTKRRCAKRRIAERYGEEEAKKYLRSTRKKIPTGSAAPAEPAPTPPAAATIASAPTSSAPAPVESSILSIDGTLRKLLGTTQPEEPVMTPAPQ